MLDVKKLFAKMLVAVQALSYDSGVQTAYGNYCKYRKVGKAVFVWGQSNNGWSIAQGGYRALTTLPVGYRPSENFYFTAGAMGGTAQITGVVNTSGVLSLYTTATTGYWTYSFMFMTS